MSSRLPLSPAALVALACLVPGSAFAEGGDFANFNWSAADPYSYDHDTGGGAFNDATKNFDIVESLEGGDFACGDIVTYLVEIPVGADACGAQTIEFQAGFTADTTGQSGAGHIEIVHVQMNYGPVQNGANPDGSDSGISDDGGSTAVLLNQYLTGPAFTSASQLKAHIRVDDLEARETSVVRIDTLLACDPGSNPTGNLQGELDWVEVVAQAPVECLDVVLPDTINSGQQTIPFKQIGDLEGAGEASPRLLKTVTTEDGSCSTAGETLDAVEGDFVQYCYSLSNDGTFPMYNVALTDDNGTAGDASDDFSVTLAGLEDLDGDGLVDDLDAGATATGSELVEIDFRGGETLTNIASADGDDGANNATFYNDTDTAQVFVTAAPEQPASIDLEVLASPDADCSDDDNVDLLSVAEGSLVYLCYYVDNSGEADVHDITISDDIATVSGIIAGLSAGESATLVSDPVFADFDFTATAQAIGAEAGGDAVLSNEDSASVDTASSGLAIQVTASLDAICGNEDDAEVQTVLEGADVYYCYDVTNTGETDVYGVSIDDPLAGVLGTADLAAGESTTFISEPVATFADETHEAFASGTDEFGLWVDSDLDAAGADVIFPSLTIDKTVSTDGTCPGTEEVYATEGDVVTYCYTVTNDGDTTIDNVTIFDGDEAIVLGTIEPGASANASDDVAVTDDVETLATASGTDSALGSTVDSDEDGAAVDVVFPELDIAITASDDGTCPGDEVVNVLIDAPVTWCYAVTNTGDVDVADISVEDDLNGLLAASIEFLAVGETAFISLDDVSFDDVLLTGFASGSDVATGSLVDSEPDAASVNIVNPDIDLDVTYSVDGSCPGFDSVEVVAGSDAWLCYDVTNLGDTAATDLILMDETYGFTWTIDALLPGESAGFLSEPILLLEDASAFASVDGFDEYGFYLYDGDAAIAKVIYSDLSVTMDGTDKIVTTEGSDASYTLTVSNLGEATAESSTLTWEIPEGLEITSISSSSGSCEAFDGVLSCDFGDLASGETVDIVVTAETTESFAQLVNNAYVATTTVESDLSNNSDSVTTTVAPGATRTIGFYGRHPAFLDQCLSYAPDGIDLGFVLIADESADDEIDIDDDSDVETALELGMGMIKSSVTKYTDRSKRTKLEQARMQAGRQVMVSWCNANLLGGSTTIDFTEAAAIMAGEDVGAILALSHEADTFNNSGNDVDLGVNPGKANAKFPWDDPTDWND
jgi:uncharacterized repeat protein (TIGR01451 family)